MLVKVVSTWMGIEKLVVFKNEIVTKSRLRNSVVNEGNGKTTVLLSSINKNEFKIKNWKYSQ